MTRDDGWTLGLVRLYPSSLRSEYGDELGRFLRAQWRERRDKSGPLVGFFRFGVDVFVDVARSHWGSRSIHPSRTALMRTRLADELRMDAAYAGRTLLRTPMFLVGALSLGLAIGATSAVYSTVDWLLNRPTHGIQEAERVVSVQVMEAARPERGYFGFSFPQYLELREVQDAFVELAAYAKLVGVLADERGAEQLVFEYVSGTYFPLLGVRPAIGRLLEPADDVEGAEPVVVLSYALWQSSYGGSPSVIGRTLRMNSRTARVVGVTPKEFDGYRLDWNGPTSVWIPVRVASELGVGNLARSTSSFFHFLGRLRPDGSIEAVAARATSWLEALPPLTATAFVPTAIAVRPAVATRVSRREPAQQFLGSLLVVSVLILIAACLNTSNAFLGRTAARSREWAIKSALGATWGRLLRQLLVEAILLGGVSAAAGAIIGAVIAFLLSDATSVYLGLATTPIPIQTTGAINVRLVALSAGLALAAALLFGFLPALAPVRSLMAAMKRGRVPWSWSGVRFTPRQGVLVLQVALSMALALTAGLYARDFARVAAFDSGYDDPESVLLARVVPRGLTPEAGNVFYAALFERLNEMPQVQAAGIGWNPPFAQGVNTFRLPGDEGAGVRAGSTAVSPGFFAAQGTPLLAGREFSFSSGEDLDAIIVNETLAKALWPEGDIIGRRVMYGTVERQVVGVVGDEHCIDLVGPPSPCGWQPFPNGTSTGYIRVRTSEAPMTFAPVLRSLVRELNPDVAVAEEATLSGYVARLTASERLAALTSAGLAAFGIVLLIVGCVSLFLSMVRDSLQEIAIRMSIGATNGRLIGRIMTQGFALMSAGTALGLGGVAVLARRLGSDVYPAAEIGPLAFVGVPSLVAIIGLGCVLYSALVATRTDPAKHLHAE